MATRQLSKPFTTVLHSIRKSSYAPVKFVGQVPGGPVHDGWAGARLPFSVKNKWAFFVKANLFLASGMWAPFLVVEYHLRKANK
ncbi:hypothetical protein AB6A40_004649 [Gnathostoma spinigerum]|uniref:Cytochrome c oxidase polypeptide VIIc n=1 Tax=Gnathostoma spinigerum TaxID=75299 RepID=A0ABD6ENT7_9BILA